MRNLSRSFVRVLGALTAAAFASSFYLSVAGAQDKEEKPADKEKPQAEKPAPDKKTREAARKAFSAGKKAYDKGDYATAYDSFREANDKIPAVVTGYYLASSLDRLDRTEEAVKAYEAVLSDPDFAKLDEQKQKDVRERLGELKAKLPAVVYVTSTPTGATVSVDGEAQEGTTPMELKLAAGAHKITVTAEGYLPKELELSVQGGERREESITLDEKPVEKPEPVAAPPPPEPPPAPPPSPPVEPRPSERSMVPAYVTLGIAGASAVVGTVFGVMALDKKKDFDRKPTTKLADDVERNALVSDMAFGVAITLGVTGAVLLTSGGVDDSEQTARLPFPAKKEANLALVPCLGPHGGGGLARLTF